MWLLTCAALFAGCVARHGASAQASAPARATRDVSGFDMVSWEASGELFISQGAHEGLAIEAEQSVIDRVVAQVANRRLRIGFRGSVQSQQPIRFWLDVRGLVELASRSSGVVNVGPLDTSALVVRSAGSELIEFARLQARTLDVRLDGAGEVRVQAGAVERQKVVIAGAATYRASALDSRQADVAIDGSGEIRLAVADRLAARIAGSGDVVYRGDPQVSRSVTGAGDVRRES
jgi:hypothetical protein